MINTFFAAIVAILVWGKISKKKLEHITNASWFLTAVYGFLTVIVIFFFYKTYQVASVYNMVQVAGLQQACDSNGNVVDTVREIVISQKFGNNPTHRDPFKDIKVKRNRNNSQDLELLYEEAGGAKVILDVKAHPDTFIAKRLKELTDYDRIRLVNLFEESNIPYQNINHLYQVSYLATSLPSFFPFYPVYEEGHGFEEAADHIYFNYYLSNSRNNPSVTISGTKIEEGKVRHPRLFDNGFFFDSMFMTVSTHEVEGINGEMTFFGGAEFINTMNFFTASDISQYNYIISLNSDCPVRTLVLDYDIPIETPEVSEHMKVYTHAIRFDSVMVKELEKAPSMIFHINIPSLANLQLIRSLILTTLLTALLSLFIKNLYYCISKWAYRKRKESRISYRNAKLLNKKTREIIKHRAIVFNNLLKYLVCSILLIVAFSSIIVLYDTSILVPIYFFDPHIILYATIIIIICIFLFVFFTYRYVRKPYVLAMNGIQKEDSSEEKVGDEENYTIFVHDKTEEEQLNELFESHMKEMEKKDDEDLEE